MTWQPEARAVLAQRAIERAKAITLPCEYCGAEVGQECTNPRTGQQLAHQPAHFRRLQDAGVSP